LTQSKKLLLGSLLKHQLEDSKGSHRWKGIALTNLSPSGFSI